MTKRKVPMRQCLGCMEKKAKKELVRVVKSPGEEAYEISLDLTGKKSGRGAYICPQLTCLQAAQKARRLERSLSCRIPPEVYQTLEEEMTRGNG